MMMSAMKPAAAMDAICEWPRESMAAAVREMLAEQGGQPNRPAATLAMPNEMTSRLPLERSPILMENASRHSSDSMVMTTATLNAPPMTVRMSTVPKLGMTGIGRLALTVPRMATPASSRWSTPQKMVASASTMSGPGAFGMNFLMPQSSASEMMAMTTAAGVAFGMLWKMAMVP
jgi:hypothetical protein